MTQEQAQELINAIEAVAEANQNIADALSNGMLTEGNVADGLNLIATALMQIAEKQKT